MRRRTAVNVFTAVLAAVGAAGVAYVVIRRKPAQQTTQTKPPGDYTIVPPPPDALWLKVSAAPEGALDSGQWFADWFNQQGMQGSDQTAEQRTRLIAALVALGADAQGFVRWRPSSLGRLTAMSIADQFERETGRGASIIGTGLTKFSLLADRLPDNPVGVLSL